MHPDVCQQLWNLEFLAHSKSHQTQRRTTSTALLRQQPLKRGSVFMVWRPQGTYFCNLAFMLSSFAAVMTFGCRPPVSHGLAANAALAAGRQPRLRSVSAPTTCVHMRTKTRCFFGGGESSWQSSSSVVSFFSGSFFQTAAHWFKGWSNLLLCWIQTK